MFRIIALLAALAVSPAFAGTIYVDTGGSATNSGSTDQNTADLSGATSTDASTVITLSGSPDLSGVVTSGANQSSIYLTNSTVANRKIYWITAKDDGADTVTVDTAPACTAGACGAWAIGGRFVWTPASIEAALRAGDQVTINNSPASTSADWITARTAGDTTSGPIRIVGKTGVRPVINVTNTNQIFEGGLQANWWLENLEFDQDGASGECVKAFGANFTFKNVKVVDCGGNAVGNTNNSPGFVILNSEITGAGGDGVSTAGAQITIDSTYIHDVSGDCVEIANLSAFQSITNSVFDTCGGRGVFVNSSSTSVSTAMLLAGNTFYANMNSGFETGAANIRVYVYNNIFQSNGDAAGEYNYEQTAGTLEAYGVHGYNIFYQGGGSAGNVSGMTLDATEITTDPLLTNPGSGDFTLQAGSPAISAGYPGQLLGTTGQGYLDLGPQQRQPSSGGAHVVGG